MKFDLSTKNLKLLYFQYKDTPYYYLAIFAIVIATSLLLMVYVVVPQTQQWFSIRNEVETTRERIAILTKNLQTVQQLNDEELTSNFQTVYTALPSEKDYLGLIQAISAAAARSGVFVGDFQFQVGDVASQSARLQVSGEQSITIKLAVINDIATASNFISEIQKKVPLSEVTTIDSTPDTTSISVTFPYRPPSSLTYNISSPIVSLSGDQVSQLKSLGEWKSSSQGISLESEAATGTATPDPF